MVGFADFLGWLGVVLLISAYLLLTIEFFTGKSRIYQLMNLVGAVFIMTNALSHSAYPSVVRNAIWVVIASYGFIASGFTPNPKNKFKY